MTSLRAIIVDDEHLARRGLALRLANIEGVEVVAECANGPSALEVIAEQSPDLVFLDIQMPGMTGFEVVERLQSDNMPLVVFVTAFNEFAVEAFKVNAVDYVLKPLEEDRLRGAVERARSVRDQQDAVAEKARLLAVMMTMDGVPVKEPASASSDEFANRGGDDRLLIREGGEVRFVPFRDIEWVDAAGDYMCVHAAGETHIMRTTMKQLEAQLDAPFFERIHRSTIVNTACISAAQSHASGEYLLTLASGAKLKVSRGYRETIKKILGKNH